MRRITAIETNVDATDMVRLDFDQRNRRRMVFITASGADILLDMPRAVHLRDGDVLRLDDGGAVRVEAVQEALLEIHAHSAAALVRIAWHLGNRHLPTQLVPGDHGGTILIRHDHVIADMVVGLGGHVRHIHAPFDPEGGAYEGGSHGHSHGRHHHHDHAHAHG